MIVAARVLFKTTRFEVAFAVAAPLALAVLSIAVSARLQELAPPPGCVSAITNPTTVEDAARCPGLADFLAMRNDIAAWLAFIGAFLPAVVGSLIGSQLVAREVEHRTAVLAWSVEPSRRRWLAERLLVSAGVVGFGGFVLAIASYLLASAQNPGVAITASFDGYTLWGLNVFIRGLAGLAIGFVIGTFVGRVLPAALLAIIAIMLVSALAIAAAPMGFPTETIPDVGGSRDPSAMYVADGLLDHDGRLVTFEEARAIAPAGLGAGDLSDWVYTNYTAVSRVIPGRDMPSVTMREAAILLLISAAMTIAGALALSRRRPY